MKLQVILTIPRWVLLKYCSKMLNVLPYHVIYWSAHQYIFSEDSGSRQYQQEMLRPFKPSFALLIARRTHDREPKLPSSYSCSCQLRWTRHCTGCKRGLKLAFRMIQSAAVHELSFQMWNGPAMGHAGTFFF